MLSFAGKTDARFKLCQNFETAFLNSKPDFIEGKESDKWILTCFIDTATVLRSLPSVELI